MYDVHIQQYRYLFHGLIMFLKPNRFGHYRFSGSYRPALARRLLNQ